MIARVREVFAAAITLILVLARISHGQTVRGRVLAPDGLVGVTGVSITAIAPAGNAVARTTSARGGVYELRLGTPGDFFLRVLRIGHRPQLIALNGVRGDTVRDIVLRDDPIQLDTVRAADVSDCHVRKEVGSTLVQVLGQARMAVRAGSLGAETAVRVHAYLLDGSVGIDGADPVTDSIAVREVIVPPMFAAQPPESLAQHGYVRANPLGRSTFEVPTADALLSDAFLAGHCFDLVRRSDTLIGLRFSPKSKRDDITDLTGTLWLNNKTTEPERVEFEYVNAPSAGPKLCGHLNGDTFCQTNHSQGRGTGGAAEFHRLASGEWLVTSWFIRTPAESLQYARVKDAHRKVNGIWELCFRPSEKGCSRPSAPYERLGTVQGKVVDVQRDGETLYADSASNNDLKTLVRLSAGKRPAGVRGFVVTADGDPLTGAMVQTTDPVRATITGALGDFEIQPLAAKSIRLAVECPGYEGVVLPLALLADSVRQVRIRLVPIPDDGLGSRTKPKCQRK